MPAELRFRTSLEKMGRLITPYRAGVTTDGLKHNKYRSKCFGRGACNRRAGGCDIHAAFDSPTGLIYPAWDTGKLTVRTNATVYEVNVDKGSGRPAEFPSSTRRRVRPITPRRGRWFWALPRWNRLV
jgi:choline dehydrogenase-like flavoprotein